MIEREEINTILAAYLPKEEGMAAELASAMNYAVQAGGKRLRPRLLLESYRAFGGTEQAAEPFAAALEMIHSYSLVHDDLPCMDNDTLRRGKPTTWAVYGEAGGVLAGDALLTYAFETAAAAFSMTAYPERAADAIALLARKAGPEGMCGGQAADVALTGQPLSENQLDFIYRLKTAALIEAAVMIGARLAGADMVEMAAAERFGRCLGVAFQIRDDILDIIAEEEELGKPVGSDTRNQKTTYVNLYGLEKAEQEVARLTEEAKKALACFPGDTSELAALTEKLKERRF
ncbi:MAG: polyprenyl synthetase family protein [Lachnospiraceae bacterium]|nr:polyprenyl synthetase family protein [Lachnospiraceae bacterium]